MKTKTAAIYVRQIGEMANTSDRQVGDLRTLAGREGWIVTSAWCDNAPLDAQRRPAVDALRREVASGRVGVVLIPTLSALGLTAEKMVKLIAEIHRAQVRLIVLGDEVEDQIDTDTPDGLAWIKGITRLQVAHDALRRERVRLGQRRARAAGTHCGRPATSPSKLAKVRVALIAGAGIRQTARQCGVSPATVWRARKLMQTEMTSSEIA